MKQGGKGDIKEEEEDIKQMQQEMRFGTTNKKKKAMEGKEKEQADKLTGYMYHKLSKCWNTLKKLVIHILDLSLARKLFLIVGLVWFGIVQYGLVWYGLVWFSMVWFGTV